MFLDGRVILLLQRSGSFRCDADRVRSTVTDMTSAIPILITRMSSIKAHKMKKVVLFADLPQKY